MRIVVKVSACKIHRVAAEQLVRTFTGKHDLHIAAGIFGEEVDGISEGFGSGSSM